MTIEGVDFSYARPGAAALLAAGKHFVVRYIRPGDGRGLTLAEVADYRAHGLPIALVFESTTSRALVGQAGGAADARIAQANVVKLGLPAGMPIYFAVDFNATAGQQPAIDAYLRGAATVLGAAAVGVYGGIGVVTRCHDNRTAAWFWQTYAWSGGKLAPFVHLYQYRNGQNVNGAVDFDRAYRADFGQAPRPAAATATARRFALVIKAPPAPAVGAVRLYSRVNGRLLGAVRRASYTCTRSRVNGLWWYTIRVGKRTGQAFKPNRYVTARPI